MPMAGTMAGATVCSAAVAARMAAIVILVGLNDSLDQVMPHHVVLIEINQRYSFDLPHHFDGFDQSRASRVWEDRSASRRP